jgi:hypothetical protein
MATGILGRSTLAQIDLFTSHYRVSGRIAVGTSGLYSLLGNPNSDYLELEDAYVSRINTPGEIVTSYATCAFSKSNISFIVLQDRRDGMPSGNALGRSSYNRGRPTEAFMTVPGFEIQGEVLVEGKPSPMMMLAQSVRRYHFVYEGKASAALHPEISYTGDLILVAVRQIGIFCLGDGM